MTRTPLFAFIARALRSAGHSRHTDESVSEFVERVSEQRPISRRQFAATTAAAASIAALDACMPRASRRHGANRPVIIVGASIAGLTAAYRLRQAGVPVRVFEAQNRVGGRMFSLRNFFADGQVCELGGELIDTEHEQIRKLAVELGITLDDLAQEDPAVTRDVYFFDGRRRSEAEVVEAFRPIAAAIERDLATIGGDGSVTYRTPNGAELLDRMTIAQWFDRAGATGWVRELLDVAYTTEYGIETDRQSALNLLLLIDPKPDPFRIFGSSDERFHVRGGNDLITTALAGRVTDSIELGTRLDAVASRADGSFTCAMSRGATSFDIAADHVLLAIPFTLLRQVRLNVALPAVKRRAIAELGYGTNAKLMVGFSDRVWRTTHRSNGSTLSDLPSQLTRETSRAQAGRSGIITNFVGGDHGLEIGRGTAAEQARLLTADLERIFPGVSAARAGMKEVRFHWPSFPWTLGSYAGYLPGQWTGICGAEAESVGRLHFAGEHCSLNAQGFMEGGCETGQMAAEAILTGLGVRRAAAWYGPQRRVESARRARGPKRLAGVA